MTSPSIGKVAILWRGDRAMRETATPTSSRLRKIFEELDEEGIKAEPAVYAEEFHDEVREQILGVDGVLVWVDPLSDGKTRIQLDPLLREVAAKGIFVSSHPDTILKMGTKEVLYKTRHLGWGTDTHIYRSASQLREEFPARLQQSGPRVLKQNRGNGGQGVWKVEWLAQYRVRVLHAKRGSTIEELPLNDMIGRCDPYFAQSGCVIDQPFQPRLPEGMIRVYSGRDKVIGFGHQLIKALVPLPPEGPDSEAAQPGPRIMSGAEDPKFRSLRRSMEEVWVPGLMETVGLDRRALPVVWDADFLYGPKDAMGDDTYVLCEINVSSVFPIPEEAPAAIAKLVREQLQGRA